jgi:hypothetical protein
MLSVDHEALVLLFRNCPELAAELLRRALGQSLPPYATATVQEADLGQIVPTAYHADLVVVLGNPEPALGIVVEVQLAPDPDKRYVWPLYAAALRAKLHCPTCVLVVTPKRSVARWARQPISFGPGRSVFTPLVLGPERVPRITDPELAARLPELAMLSVQAHSDEADAEELTVAALAALDALHVERRMIYLDVVLRTVSQAFRLALEKRMQATDYVFRSKFATEYLDKGRAEGEAKGRAEGEAEAVLRVLRARGLQVTADQEARIRACSDLPTLESWLDRAVTVTSADELLAP